MTLVTVQWKCREPHPGCSARTWRDYQQMRLDTARFLLKHQAPHVPGFRYRIKPTAKYCDDPDNCGYADCPTAFCDKNKSNLCQT